MKKIAAFLLAALMCLSFALVSCGPTDPTDTTTTGENPVTTTGPASANPAIAAIAGDYLLDAKPFGMAMSWYVRIGADESFKISTKRDFSVDKGNGVVTENNGTFVFVYSHGTTTEPITATFTVADGNLVFSTAVPVGAATVSSGDAENPVTAYTMAHEELFGEYCGTYVKESAMAGTTTYEYSIVLAAGRKYTFTSSFSSPMGAFTLVETGSFAIDGTTFTITPKTIDKGMGAGAEAVTIDPVAGTLENGVITAAFQHSAMASSRAECTAQKTTTSEVAGTYAGQKSVMGGMMTIQVALVLDKFGGYQYIAVSATGGAMGGAMGDAMGGMPSMSEPSMYGEKGTFTFTATEIVLTKTHDYDVMNDEATPVSGTVTPITVTRGALSVSGTALPTSGAATSATLYHDSILTLGPTDIYTAECTTEEATDGVARTAALTLNPDATFEIEIKVDETTVYTVEGSFTVSANPMTGTQLSLVLADESATLVGMVADGMINIQNVPVDGNGTEINFGFER